MDIEEEEGTQTPKLVIDEGTKRGTDSPERPTTSNEEPMGRVEEESNLSVKTCGTELMSETGSSALACGGEPSPSSTSSFELHEETSERGSIMDPKDPPEGASEDKQEASTSAETKEISEPELNKESPKFDWKTYLAETESDPAPRCNFYQTMGPIQNNLKEDMKIECQDPRGPTGKFCLTNVEAVHSVFACVRLMGCDSSNDRWLLCNDRNIQYIGYTRDQGKGDLEPPVGYMYNMAKFRTFLDAQLQDGEPATRDVIDSIPLDVLPKKNMFEVGQKLEAIDPQNFMGTVHPATVLDVNGKTVKIAFDGWPKGYDMVCSFDSRYIFPIGWADSVQMKLEPPPKPKKKRKIEVKTEAKDEQQTPVPPKKKKSAVSSKSKGKDRRSKSSTPKVTLKEEPKKSQTKSTKTKKKESIKKEPCDTPDPTPEKALPKRSKSKKPHENLTKEEEFDNSSPVVKLSQSTLDQLLVPITDFNSKSKTFSSPDRKPTASPRKSETPAPTIFEKLKASGSFQSSRSTTPEDPPKPVAEGTKMAVDSTPKVSRPFARKSLGPPAGKSTSGSSVSSTAKSKKQPVKQDPTPPKPTLPHLEKSN